MSLWDWAVAAYARPRVGEACLDLQDIAGQNVPLLLWAAWSGTTEPEAVADACDLARAWTEVAIAPLRAVRRALKLRSADLDDAAREAMRAEVKAVELSAERRLIEALETVGPGEAGPGLDRMSALVAVARGWGGVVPRELLSRLAQSLPA